MKALTFLFTFLFLIPAFAHVSTAVCELQNQDGSIQINTGKIYPTRGGELFRIGESTQFADIKFDAMAPMVRIEIVDMPHHPFTFGESVQSRIEMKITGDQTRDNTVLNGSPNTITASCVIE